MNGTTIGLEQTEEKMLAYEISDEALELAGGTATDKAKNMTLFYCTYLDLCPGP